MIDPHGDVAEALLKVIPKERLHKLIYLNPADAHNTVTLNPLSGVSQEHRHLVASGLISTFKKIWSESWGPRMEYILRFSLLTLLEFGEATLLDIQLTDTNFRKGVLMRLSSPHLLSFWEKEFEKYPSQFRNEAIAPILNKLRLFTASVTLNRTVGHTKSTFPIEQVMNEGKILLANLSKGKIGEDASSLLGNVSNGVRIRGTLKSKYPESRNESLSTYMWTRCSPLFLFLLQTCWLGQESIGCACSWLTSTLINFRSQCVELCLAM